MVANILPLYLLPKNHRDGTIGRNSTFSEHGHVAYQIKWNHEMQQHGSKYYVRRSPPPHTHTHIHTPLTGSISQNSAFSEHGHVAYQIKWNHEMQQHSSNYFAWLHAPDPANRSKVNFFQNIVMLHIKLKGIMNAATL